MYTEIELSEFLLRCRSKIGEYAYDISEGQRYGRNVDNLITDSATLRIFVNTVNSNHLNWTTQEIYTRVEHVTDRFKLINRPTYNQDYLDKFQPLQQLVKEGGTFLELPQVGEGYVYLNNGVISLIPEKEHTISDLPKA